MVHNIMRKYMNSLSLGVEIDVLPVLISYEA